MFAGVVIAGASGWLLGRHGATREITKERTSRAGEEESLSPLPPWVREMLTVDEATLMSRAGDYERWSRQILSDRRITPGFVRLLEVASRVRSSISDPACACAVRTLAKLERFDLIREWLATESGVPLARREAETLLEEQLPFSARSKK